MEAGWVLAFVGVVLGVVTALNAAAQVIASRLALQAVLWASAEKGLVEVQQWEVRAMAAFMFEGLPWLGWLRCFMLEHEFEARCVETWKEMFAGYDLWEPRECRELFGETGPW